MVSQTAEYALRAVVYLASLGGEPRTTRQIGERTRVPVGYLAKVMQGLARSGIVQSRRGLGGGFVLRADPARLSVLDVVAAVDPPRRITRCPLGIPGHINLCPLHRRLDRAAEVVEAALRESTIAELLAEPNPRRGIPVPLCS